MGAGYTRQAASNIAAGLNIHSVDFNLEFNTLAAAFNGSTGHAHDGTAGNGPKLDLVGSTAGTLPLSRGGTNAVDAGSARASLGVTIGTNVQAWSAKLDAVAAVSSTGYIALTGAGTAAPRSITGDGTSVIVTNGDGVAGNTSIALGGILNAIVSLASTGFMIRSGSGLAVIRSLATSGSGIGIANVDGVAGNPTFSLDAMLTGLVNLASTGVLVRTGAGTSATRSITNGSNIAVTNGDGVAGNITIAFAPADDSISGDKIDGGVISHFRSTGITDNSVGTIVTLDASGNAGIGVAPGGSFKLEVGGSIKGSAITSTGAVSAGSVAATGAVSGAFISSSGDASVSGNGSVTGNLSIGGTLTVGGNSLNLPPGVIMDFAGGQAVVPAGWLLCDGSAVNRTTYSALFTIIGTVYGVGDNSTTFNLPDLRGRVTAGRDNMGGIAANRVTSGGSGIAGGTLGAIGGEETHVLTIPEMPAHTHTINERNGNLAAGSTEVATGFSTPQTTMASNSTGGGTAHNNMQPTLVLNKIIKI